MRFEWPPSNEQFTWWFAGFWLTVSIIIVSASYTLARMGNEVAVKTWCDIGLCP